MLREGLFHRLGDGGGAGGLELPQQSEHLLAERVLDQRRLVRVFVPQDLAEALGVGIDAALAAVVPKRRAIADVSSVAVSGP
ncbi:hypothetical protein [Streptomyces sp. NPDC005525]|uniref:hypothetical protein n=1 Tax=Streptomyces sp. NPDC005525 TaxID=3364720 RepID=UPI0036B2180A